MRFGEGKMVLKRTMLAIFSQKFLREIPSISAQLRRSPPASWGKVMSR
jgi:hypothetical protein